MIFLPIVLIVILKYLFCCEGYKVWPQMLSFVRKPLLFMLSWTVHLWCVCERPGLLSNKRHECVSVFLKTSKFSRTLISKTFVTATSRNIQTFFVFIVCLDSVKLEVSSERVILKSPFYSSHVLVLCKVSITNIFYHCN